MGFFSKNKNEDIGFIINTDDDIKISGDKNLAPHAMTPQEVSDLWVLGEDDQTVTTHNALDSLKKRMNTSTQNSDISDENAKITSQPKEYKPQPEQQQKSDVKISEKDNEKTQKSLLEKLQPYTVDEHGQDLSKSTEPLYHLESVAEILKCESENSIKKLSKKYDIFVDDLSKTNPEDDKSIETATSVQNVKKETKPTTTFKQMVTDAEKREEEQLYQSLLKDEQTHKHNDFDIDIPDISDIDNREFGVNNEKPIADTATIRFTPIKDNKGNTDHITISSVTRHIDLEDNISDASSVSTLTTLEESEFEKFQPEKEVTDLMSGRKILRTLALKKRSAFLGVSGSVVALFALLIFLIPPVFDFIISNPKSAMFVCGSFLLISVLSNINMFHSFAKLFKKQGNADVLAAVSSIFALLLAVCAALTNSNAYYMILLCSILLLSRAISHFKSVSAMHSNLKQILNESPKKAVTLINDSATTFAMSKNTIEGDVLICAHKKTNFIEDFIKHSTFNQTISSKLPLIFGLSLALSLLSGIIAFFYYDNIFDLFYCACSISMLTTIPTVFFIDSFSLSSAAKKLNSNGAMIAGLYGAEKIENTNAAVISINDIFPEGTISMYSMKVLSDNNIDQTILKAASLTAAVGSPLEAIFKQIAGTNSSYAIPDSDTVKYEKRLGISGWVDNELLFIGNRSLMEAHGIPMPSIEIDKKILRKGYFPVYVSTENTACALIVIQYDVRRDIAKELRKITEMGVTLLVDNCDPNVNEEMLCDYFGLYEDSVKIMTNAGVYMYKNATPFSEKCSAPASFRGSGINFIKIINCASNIKKSNLILTVLYTLFAVFGIVYFLYASFSGTTSIPQQTTILIYQLATTFLSIIGFLIRKP